ncbi:unnamed protein product [Rotaria socialis]|uniref:EGF-like domain-containing protein n=1 Tax=Rotaria socialis TaxID=392032 RepID=A0A821LKZ1_9BILA|nr:unnamed protein product [Rotaria socialis]CAF4752479.1 unnamed protein product [Rotaria socialis]
MALYGRLLYAWLPLLAFLLQAFHGGFAHSYCDDNNGGYDPNALCSEDPTTYSVKCTCKPGYTNTGSTVNVVCKDSCTIKNGGCGPHAACSHHANTYAVKCTDKADYTNRGSASEERRTDTRSASGDIRIGTVSVS